MEETRVLNMSFNTSLGSVRNLRFPNPRSIISEENIAVASASLISANPFDETIGELVSLARAELITTHRTVLI